MAITRNYGVTPVLSEAGGHPGTAILTRPNTVTPYAINDAIGDVSGSAIIEFTNMGPVGADIYITSLTLEIDAATSTIGTTNLRLYNVLPPTAIADNDAWDVPVADRGKYIDGIFIQTPIDLGSTLMASVDGINKQISLVGSSVFAILTTDIVFTPVASIVYRLTLHAIEL